MKRYRVAIDARRLSGLRRGVGRYIHLLTSHLSRHAPDIEVLLCVDRRLPQDVVPNGCTPFVVGTSYGAPVKRFWDPGARIHSVYWMNVLLPLALQRARADLFHGTNYALPLRTPCPAVATIHDMIYARVPDAFEPAYRRYMQSLVPRVARQADHIIADSHATRADIIGLLAVEPGKVTVVHLGVGQEFRWPLDETYLADVKRRLSLPDKFVLHVGAVERRKNLGLLLGVCRERLCSGALDAIVLAGEDGYQADKVRAAAAELGIERHVVQLGYVGQSLLPGLYSLARVLSLVSPYEGFGLPVIEAMACGTPVVTSDCSSLPEVAGGAALLVAPGDAAALARAIESLLTDAALRSSMIQKGLARARQFRWTDTAAAHADVYRKVIAEARR
jgi:glycosyltransferase involved in cell wall biosynthesis